MPQDTPHQRLRSWREGQNLSRTQLAAQLGCSENWVWKLENRDAKPSQTLAMLIEHRAGIPADSWFGFTDETVTGALTESRLRGCSGTGNEAA